MCVFTAYKLRVQLNLLLSKNMTREHMCNMFNNNIHFVQTLVVLLKYALLHQVPQIWIFHRGSYAFLVIDLLVNCDF